MTEERLRKAQQILSQRYQENQQNKIQSLNYSEIKINLKGSPGMWGVKNWKQLCLLKCKQAITDTNLQQYEQYSPVLTLVVKNTTTVHQIHQFVRKKLQKAEKNNQQQASKQSLQLYCLGRLISTSDSQTIKEIIDKYHTNYFTCARMEAFGNSYRHSSLINLNRFKAKQ